MGARPAFLVLLLGEKCIVDVQITHWCQWLLSLQGVISLVRQWLTVLHITTLPCYKTSMKKMLVSLGKVLHASGKASYKTKCRRPKVSFLPNPLPFSRQA